MGLVIYSSSAGPFIKMIINASKQEILSTFIHIFINATLYVYKMCTLKVFIFLLLMWIDE